MLQALKLLEEAVTAGYSGALTIDSTSVESLLGLADAHLAAGKLLARSEAFMKASKFLEAGDLFYPIIM